MGEFITFLKYLIIPNGLLKDLGKGFLELLHPKRLSYIFILASILSVLLLPYNKKLVAGMFLFLAMMIQFRLIYKAGDHNRWRNEQIKKIAERRGGWQESKENQEENQEAKINQK